MTLVIFILAAIAIAVYYIRGVNVDIAYAFEGEDVLEVEFNPERKSFPTPELRARITSDSREYQQLYAWFEGYEGAWLKENVIAFPNDIIIRGDDLIITMSGTGVEMAFNNRKGYVRHYRASAQEGDFAFLWELMPEQ